MNNDNPIPSTEEKTILGEIRTDAEIFSAVFHMFPNPISVSDENGTILAVNEALAQLHGFKPEQLIGKKTVDLGLWRHPEDRARILAEIKEKGKVDGMEVELKSANGEFLNMLFYSRWISINGKRLLLSVSHNVTALRKTQEDKLKLEQQIMQAQKLESLGVMAGGIAHDFNNLLTSILGNTNLALSELSMVSGARSHMEEVEQAARRAAELCRQLLAYSGKGRFLIRPLSLNELVHEMGQMLSVTISQKAIVQYNLSPALPSVIADATQLRQVVMNLITNAAEAIDVPCGLISITTGTLLCEAKHLLGVIAGETLVPGRYVFMEVKDNGQGMDKETMTRIFDPFFTTKVTGRGLGLAAVLGIVQGHKGCLQVSSEKGKGTCFKILLPAYDLPAETVVPVATPSLDWKGHGTLLIAEDDEAILKMSCRILESAGFKVLTAADGQEALTVFRRHQNEIRLVLLDMTMPRLDGEACLLELRRLNPTVKVIMTSGHNEQEVINRFTGKGLTGFIQKPYTLKELLPKIREVLGE